MTSPCTSTVDLGLLLVGAVDGGAARHARSRSGCAAAAVARAIGSPPRHCRADAAASANPADSARRRGAAGRRRRSRGRRPAAAAAGALPFAGAVAARERETSAAEDLLRKSIRAATRAGHKDATPRRGWRWATLPTARATLPPPASTGRSRARCFASCANRSEHDAVEARMQRNGCPTDWVLTDF